MKLFEKFSAVFLLASLFVLPICSTLAADLTTLDGQIYKNISVIQTNKTFVMVKHSGGITVVSYRDMTEADKLLYGYNSGAGSTSTDSAQTTSPSQATTTAPIIKSITTNQLMAIMLNEPLPKNWTGC